MSTSNGGLNAHLGAEKAFAPFEQVWLSSPSSEKSAVKDGTVKE